MNVEINLDDDTSELYEQLTRLTGLAPADLISRQLSAHHAEGHELLALVTAHPELREQAANLLESYGPESLMVGIARIAPRGYVTMVERFERDLNDALGTGRTVD
jgi:hypothetical protein